MKQFFLAASLVAALGVVLVATATPSFGQDSGNVEYNVRVSLPPAPCITLGNTALTHGTLGFTPTGAVSATEAVQVVNITSCATESETFAVRGTNAVGSGTGAWRLSEAFHSTGAIICTGTNLNEFGLSVGIGTISRHLNTTSYQSLISLAPAQIQPVGATLHMPCAGSSGAGEIMRWQIQFLATIP